MAVFVLDAKGKPLMPCSEKRARLLLSRGRALVHRVIPFVIRLKDRLVRNSELQPLEIGVDPGSKETGLALRRVEENMVRQTGNAHRRVHGVVLANLVHRGAVIRKALVQRSAFRRRRRSQLRYRAPRFDNRTRSAGRLPPALQHRVESTETVVNRWCRWAPVTAIHQELVRFDTQQLENPEITGMEYQQGTLAGYEIREYLLEKWGRQCAYCDAKNVPLQIEHIYPKANGGSNRIANLTLACNCCNQKKGSRDVLDFVKDPARLSRILVNTKRPLKDATAVNATRWALFEALKRTGLPVVFATGGRTKFNRCREGITKDHCLDALCVGVVDAVQTIAAWTLIIKSTGRGEYSRTRLNKHGFPRGYCSRQKSVFGFQTGDRVVANVKIGKKIGLHVGRVAVRASGFFNIQTGSNIVQGISHKHCKITQRGDGYGYSFAETIVERQLRHQPKPKIAVNLQEDARTG